MAHPREIHRDTMHVVSMASPTGEDLGVHLQEDPGDPPPAVAGLRVGLKLPLDLRRHLHLVGHKLLQLAHVGALQLTARILLCQRHVLVLPIRLLMSAACHAHVPTCTVKAG